jgi:hypothetical protein
MGDVTHAAVDPDATPAALLVAWRELERRRATAGAPDRPALTATMRELMDRYEWVTGGRVGPPPLAGLSAT